MKGMTVQYVKRTQTGTDPFGVPVYSETLEDVKDVLVGNPSSDDVNTSVSLYGKKIDFVLGIPRGDMHDWSDAEVIIWGDRFRTLGYPERGIDENIPLRWNQNVRVTRYG